MRRYAMPYNGKRFLLNKNTNELHDLDNETTNCQIDEINKEYIEMFETLQEAEVCLVFRSKNLNGCYWCMRSLDKG